MKTPPRPLHSDRGHGSHSARRQAERERLHGSKGRPVCQGRTAPASPPRGRDRMFLGATIGEAEQLAKALKVSVADLVE